MRICQRTLDEAHNVNNRNSVMSYLACTTRTRCIGQIMTKRAHNSKQHAACRRNRSVQWTSDSSKDPFAFTCIVCLAFRFVFTHPFMRCMPRSHHMVVLCNGRNERLCQCIVQCICRCSLKNVWIICRCCCLKLVVYETFCHSSRHF